MLSDAQTLVILGPTASGKSDLAARVAARAGFEVVSMDSMQVYRGIPIVTAQPEPELTALAPHHLLEIVDPADHFDTGEYLRRAGAVMREIRSRGRRVLFAGGTWLYYRALVEGLSELPRADAALRAQLLALEQAEGPGSLHRRLAAVDSASAARLHPNDLRRIVRALEIHAQSGQSLSDLGQLPKERLLSSYVAVGLSWPRAELYRRIDRRVEKMWSSGLVGEMEALHARLPAGRMTVKQAIGYAQIGGFLERRHDEAEAKRLVQRDSRRFARRQILQFQRMPGIHWLDAHSHDVDALMAQIMRL